MSDALIQNYERVSIRVTSTGTKLEPSKTLTAKGRVRVRGGAMKGEPHSSDAVRLQAEIKKRGR